MTGTEPNNLLQRLNFHHLYYLWVTSREGGVSRAAKRLRLAQSTVSAQLKDLERSLGVRLLERRGRHLELTPAGRMAFRYADDIFNLGQELLQELEGSGEGHVERLRIGVAMVVPKLLVHRLLAPLRDLPVPPKLVLTEDSPDRLLAELALHGNDLVLSDAPVPESLHVRAYHHLLEESPLRVFAAPALLQRHGQEFPACMAQAPLLLPTPHAAIRAPLERWLTAQGLRPKVVGEFQDSALMKVYGQQAAGFFVAPASVEDAVCLQYGVQAVGTTSVLDRLFAITLNRKIRHPTIQLLVPDTAPS